MMSNDPHQLDLLPNPEIESVSKIGVEQRDLHGSPAEFSSEITQLDEIRLPATDAEDDDGMSVGMLLRAERERRGWTCEEVASRLKLQASLVRRIEREDFSGIAHAVYLRGYLTSYTRLLGLPSTLADRVASRNSEQVPLVSTGTVSRSRYLLDRYSVSATYLILTGLVIGPAVWLATHGGLEQNLAHTVMLDGQGTTFEAPVRPPSATESSAPAGMPPSSAVIAEVPPGVTSSDGALVTEAKDPTPIVASMAPFSAIEAPVVSPVAATPAGRHTLTLKLKQASWVEVTALDGQKLEYGLLEAGTEHNYSSDSAISVRIGNAQGAEVSADGQTIDLAPFRRANVAHLRVFAEGALATRVDS